MLQKKYTSLLLTCLIIAHANATGWQLQPAEGPDNAPIDNKWVDQLRINTITAMLSDEPYTKVGASAPEWTQTVKGSSIQNAWFRTTMEIPQEAKGQSVWIDFPHIEGDGILWINGKKWGELIYPNWTINVSDWVDPGQSAEILLYLTRTYHGISRNLEDDRLAFYALRSFGRTERRALGVLYEPELLLRGYPAWIEHIRILSDDGLKGIKAMVRVGGSIPNETRLELSFYDEDDYLFKSAIINSIKPGENWINMDFIDAIPWELQNPYLYTLKLNLTCPDGVIESRDQPYGHRQIEIRQQHVYINGHRSPFRLHTPSHSFRGTKFLDYVAETFSVNVFKAVDNALFFHGVDRTLVVHSNDILEHLDREGLGMLLPLPYMQAFRTPMPFDDDPLLREQYQDVLRRSIERMERHPSILGWKISMNVLDYNTYIKNLSPPHLGILNIPGEDPVKKRGFEVAVEMVKEIDPSRIVYGHAAGNMGGDMAGANIHMNFIPVDEKEAWHSEWAARGDKPWIHDEGGGAPYYPNYFLKRFDLSGGRVMAEAESEPAVTEFSAEFYGDSAYHMEPEILRRSPWEFGLQNTRQFGVSFFMPTPETPMPASIEKYQIEANVRSNRAWRTWQVQGWFPWIGEWSYRWQHPPADNPSVEAYRDSMAPLLAYIGGYPKFFYRDRNYSASETIKKQIIFVFDGPMTYTYASYEWSLLSQEGDTIQSNSIDVKLKKGAVTKLPITINPISGEGFFKLELRDKLTGKMVDDIPLFIYSDVSDTHSSNSRRNIHFLGEVDAFFKQQLESTAPSSHPIIVIGRNGLRDLQTLPFTDSEIASGTQVIIFEQQPEDLLRLGLRSEIRGIRRAWIRQDEHPLMQGVSPESLQDWRGSATLRPQHEAHRYWGHRPARIGMSPQRPARWGNHGNVVSVMIETPTRGSFLPIVECGFDLGYTPLMEWQHGDGRILFCQLDVTDRTETDPVAKLILKNIAQYLSQVPQRANRSLNLATLSKEREMQFSQLGLSTERAHRDIQIVDLADISRYGRSDSPRMFVAFEQNKHYEGFDVLKDTTLLPGLATQTIGSARIGPGLLRWRDSVNIYIRDGQVAGRIQNNHFIGIPPNAFAPPYNSLQEMQRKRMSHRAVHEIYRRSLVGMGAQSSAAVSSRVTRLTAIPTHRDDSDGEKSRIAMNLETSHPISLQGLGGKALLDALSDHEPTHWESSSELIARRDQAHYGTAGDVSFQDFAYLFKVNPDTGRGIILRGQFELKERQRISLIFRPDWWGRVKLNDETVIDLSDPSSGHGYGTATLDLEAGKHNLRVEVVSGSAGFETVLHLRKGEAGDTGQIQSLLIRSTPANVMLPYNPINNELYFTDMRDEHDPYLYKTW